MVELIDLHCHTLASGHAYSTVKENIDIANEKGLKYLGISDHAPKMPGGAHIYHFNNLGVIPKKVKDLRVLKGVEANIIDYDGNIDMSEEDLERLDYGIASLHPPCICPGDIDQNTNAIIKAMKHKKIKIIGHPDDSRYPLDYKKIVMAAKENNILLEVNNSSLRPNGFREGAYENVKRMLKICMELKVSVIFGSDSHICYDIGKFDNCIRLIEEVKFPKELIINYNEEDIKNIFNI